ncbi:SixA phosphatase family protein [Bradyrhizobium sp. 2TAF24]|uniref:SixA phosphatase family protein n=1 Tax=Bradyrhizobium sp. 2TAF24 TaxID=3233011 RepID=UPI003F9237EA
MRRLLLLRHAKTEKDGPTGRDRDRRLDERGHRDAQEIGAYIAEHGLVPAQAFVSTAVRTRQTWDIVSKEWPEVTVDHLDELYGADAGGLLGIVRAAVGDDPQSLLVVAHNPGLHEFHSLQYRRESIKRMSDPKPH